MRSDHCRLGADARPAADSDAAAAQETRLAAGSPQIWWRLPKSGEVPPCYVRPLTIRTRAALCGRPCASCHVAAHTAMMWPQRAV